MMVVRVRDRFIALFPNLNGFYVPDGVVQHCSRSFCKRRFLSQISLRSDAELYVGYFEIAFIN